MQKTFIEAVLAGEAQLADIDDYVDAWHTADEEGPDLPEFLGMTFEEYAQWVGDPKVLEGIVETRRLSLLPPS